jgi:hypothetical protein
MTKEYDGIVEDCANQGRSLMLQLTNNGAPETLYLYVRPSTETHSGKLLLARDSAPNPEKLELVTGEGLRINIPYSEYYKWVWNRARRAPVMCWGVSIFK